MTRQVECLHGRELDDPFAQLVRIVALLDHQIELGRADRLHDGSLLRLVV